jgi:hypothetical protein
MRGDMIHECSGCAHAVGPFLEPSKLKIEEPLPLVAAVEPVDVVDIQLSRPAPVVDDGQAPEFRIGAPWPTRLAQRDDDRVDLAPGSDEWSEP